MTLLLTALLFISLPFTVTKEDLRKLLDAGVGDQVIIEYIRSNGPAEPLSVEEVTELKKAGASDSVLRAMLEASRASDAMTPSYPKDRATTSSDDWHSYYRYPSYSYYSYTPYYYPYSTYYYPTYYYPSYSFSSYPRSYYPYRYPYRYDSYSHPRYYSRPGTAGVTPYRNAHPSAAQPRHGVGTYRR